MVLVIDGFNLIYKFPELETLMYEHKLNLAREGLLKILHRYKVKRGNTVIHVFFDGKKDMGSEVREDEYGGIKIYFSHDVTADYCIKQFIRHDTNPSVLYVVSSDKDIIFYCKRYGCRSQKSEEFADWVNKFLNTKEIPEEKDSEVKLSDSEIDYWKNIFSGKDKGKE